MRLTELMSNLFEKIRLLTTRVQKSRSSISHQTRPEVQQSSINDAPAKRPTYERYSSDTLDEDSEPRHYTSASEHQGPVQSSAQSLIAPPLSPTEETVNQIHQVASSDDETIVNTGEHHAQSDVERTIDDVLGEGSKAGQNSVETPLTGDYSDFLYQIETPDDAPDTSTPAFNSDIPLTTQRHNLRKDQHRERETRRHFDLSAHPQITSEELQRFLADGLIGEDRSWRYVDALLMAAFAEITLIGELPIDESTFHSLAVLIRSNFVLDGKLKIKKVTPALFVTSMVFSARYSDVNARSFWEPYAKLVWGLDEASQYMQLQCREHFRDCRIFLSERVGHLNFHVEDEGDVARPVFQHVMIPYYLQDDFAEWLLQQSEMVVDIPPSLLPDSLRNDSSLRYVAPRLQRFIREPDTTDAAAALIRQLAEAISLYQDGEAVADILQMMNNPIEKSMWETIAERLLATDDLKQVRHVPRPRLEWIWSIHDSAMQIRLTNVVSTAKPDLCVWVDAEADDLLSAPAAEQIIPWDQPDGRYLLDEVILSDGPVDGRIVVLSENYDGSPDDILLERSVPNLPVEPIVFFRLTQQNAYGIPLEKPNASGEWLVSMAEGVTLHDESGQRIQPRQRLYTPDLLREHANHTLSGQFSLTFPITVKRDETAILELTDDEDMGVLRASVVGDKPIESLAPNVPPTFEDSRIYIKLPTQLQRLSRIALSIRSQSNFGKVVRLSDLPVEYRNDHTVIDLSSILPKESGVYRLNLRRDLQSMLPAPLEFSVLEGISVISPEQGQIYTPANPPEVRLQGIHIDDVIVQKNTAILEQSGRDVIIRWEHFRSNLIQLELAANSQRVPLAWHIERFYVWVSGTHGSSVTEETVNDAIIYVRGQRYQQFDWIVGEARRPQKLDARGQLDLELRYDALYDMLRQSNSTHTDVSLSLSTVRWKIFSYVRRPTVTDIDATYDSVQQQLDVKVEVSPVLKGRYELQIQKQDSAELMVLDISGAIGRRQTFNISLEPGNYHLTALELGQSLAIGKAACTTLHVADRLIVVQDIDCSSDILRDANNLLYYMHSSNPHMFFTSRAANSGRHFRTF